MARTSKILEIFVASPSDVTVERNSIDQIVEEFNSTWSEILDTSLRLKKWESNARPGLGRDAQDVINQQIGDEYDIFLGIMWGRFGTPTDRAGSGTEEEFDRAYARYASHPNSVEILFYFKDAGISPSLMQPDQLQRVVAFKSKMADHGCLYWTFETTQEFKRIVRVHLARVVQDWIRKSDSVPESHRIAEADAEERIIESIEQFANVFNQFGSLSHDFGVFTILGGKR